MKPQSLRLLIFAALVVVYFIVRVVYPVFKNGGGNGDGYPAVRENLRKLNNLILTTHARCRMACRHITEAEVRQVLKEGELNEKRSDLKDPRGPSYALEGYSQDGQHLRVVVAPHQDEVIIISCIDLDKDWACDCN